jgi:hypothetical protein
MRKFSIKMHHETRWDMVLIDNEGEAYHFRGMIGDFNMPVMKQQKRMIITLYNEFAVCSVRYYVRKYVAPDGTVYGGKYKTVKSSFGLNGELPCLDLHI